MIHVEMPPFIDQMISIYFQALSQCACNYGHELACLLQNVLLWIFGSYTPKRREREGTLIRVLATFLFWSKGLKLDTVPLCLEPTRYADSMEKERKMMRK